VLTILRDFLCGSEFLGPLRSLSFAILKWESAFRLLRCWFCETTSFRTVIMLAENYVLNFCWLFGNIIRRRWLYNDVYHCEHCFSRISQYCHSLKIKKSRDSSVGIATRLRAGRSGFDSRRGVRIFLFTTASITALGPTQPPIRCVPGALSLRVRRPGREADHSHPSSAEVKECVELYLHSPNTPSLRGA
jgi:hypothetical protein